MPFAAGSHMTGRTLQLGWDRARRGSKSMPNRAPWGQRMLQFIAGSCMAVFHAWSELSPPWRSLCAACNTVSKFLAPEEKILPKSFSFPEAPPPTIPRGASFSLDGKREPHKFSKEVSLLHAVSVPVSVFSPKLRDLFGFFISTF